MSLTDRCNLRCTYCMPAEGLDWLPGDQLLHPDELIRLLRIAVTRLGITSVRFTGGEPLVAKHLEDVVAATAALRPRPEITLTTNGIGLDKRAAKLKRGRAGPDQRLTGHRRRRALRPHHPPRPAARRARRACEAAKAAGLEPVKVNAVLDPVTGLDDAVALLRFCLDHGYQLRIIEQMPLDAGHQWQRGRAITADDVLATLRQALRSDARLRRRGVRRRRSCGRSTVESWARSASSPRSRTRSARPATAPGSPRTARSATACSLSQETDLRALLRAGADDDALEAAWRAAMWAKAAGHGINDPGFVQPDRPMSAIGG